MTMATMMIIMNMMIGMTMHDYHETGISSQPRHTAQEGPLNIKFILRGLPGRCDELVANGICIIQYWYRQKRLWVVVFADFVNLNTTLWADPLQWGLRGGRGLGPSSSDVRAHPSEGCSPLHGWADTNFPRVSNTTSRHPFDTLVTGMGWSCAAELKKAERIFHTNGTCACKKWQGTPSGSDSHAKDFQVLWRKYWICVLHIC